MQDESKITISPEDVDKFGRASFAEDGQPPNIPTWWRIASLLLVFIPPILYLFTIFQLIYLRKKDAHARYVYTRHCCLLLLASGIIWLFLLMVLVAWSPSPIMDFEDDTTALYLDSFPDVPSESALSGRDIAHQLLPLVAIVHHPGRSSSVLPGLSQTFGAASLVISNPKECVFVTSKHVIEALTPKAQLGQRVGITLQDGQEAASVVVGLHEYLDLALLWAKRDPATESFFQPVRHFNTIGVGDMVFAIGHPEGFAFSMAGGLIAQTRGKDILQISVPISPGNSGGPVFDTHGNLLAIVKSAIDKTKSPQAEVLNFAVRADALFEIEDWQLSEKGQIALNSLHHFFDQ